MKPVLLFLFAFISIFAQAQKNAFLEGRMISLKGMAQGTTYHIKYRDEQQRSFQKEIDSLLADIDKSLSIYRPDSEISQFNRSMSHRFQSPHF